MNKANKAEFFRRLAQRDPAPTTELHYASTFQLLVAVILSAQATDVSVNKATATLYQVAPDPSTMLALGVAGLKTHIRNIGLFNTKAENVIKTCRILLQEHGGAGLYQPLDLGIASCRMIVAVRKGFDYAGAVRTGARLRVATKYVRAAREHFAQKGVHVDLIRLYGSMELAPITGLADAIVDLVSSGNTLKANDLVAVEEVMQVSARLIVNQAALKTRRAVLQPMIDAFTRASGFRP